MTINQQVQEHVAAGVLDGPLVEALTDPHAPPGSREWTADLIAATCGPVAGALAAVLARFSTEEAAQIDHEALHDRP